MCVAPNHVAALTSLELPWGNNNYVAFTNPDPSLHFSTDTAQSFCAVLALHHYAVKPEQLSDYAQDFAFAWVSHFANCAFV